MFKIYYSVFFLIIIFIFTNRSNSQNIPYHVNLDTTLTNVADSALIYVKNPSGQLINISSVRTLTSKFFTRVNSFSINPFDSVLIWILFKTNQNITYNDFIIFESEQLNYPIINYLIATAKYPDALYSFTQGLSDESLKTALRNFCSTNTNNNYSASRTAMFSTIDDYNMNDSIECVYTGRKVFTTGIPSVNPPQSMNTEHTFPQSFFNENEPMRSDIHHLFPSDEQANSRRSNYDFGFVVSNITWQNAGSKLGFDFENQIIFEARDQHKGNIARCLFYFLIRYGNPEVYMDLKQEKVLREWNLIDEVDDHERIRNNGIQAFQNNRSPFVD
ncbi:MAG: endonuclease, partial [Ignavibacteria bacterium]